MKVFTEDYFTYITYFYNGKDFVKSPNSYYVKFSNEEGLLFLTKRLMRFILLKTYVRNILHF